MSSELKQTCIQVTYMKARRTGELSYKESLLALDVLRLTFDREVKPLVFLYRTLFGYVNVDVSDYIVCFASQSPSNSADNVSKYNIQSQIFRTTTFHSSYHIRAVKVWGIVCKNVCLEAVSSRSL